MISALKEFKIVLPFHVKNEGWKRATEHRKDPMQKTLLLELLILPKPSYLQEGAGAELSELKLCDCTPQA